MIDERIMRAKEELWLMQHGWNTHGGSVWTAEQNGLKFGVRMRVTYDHVVVGKIDRDRWRAHVDLDGIRLVETGMRPWDAVHALMTKAGSIVSGLAMLGGKPKWSEE